MPMGKSALQFAIACLAWRQAAFALTPPAVESKLRSSSWFERIRVRMNSGGHRQSLLICTLLGAITLAAYWPVLDNGFINLDDYGYVSKNPHVQTGLTWENVKWAFEAGYAGNWHPLTWLSHMLDVQLFSLNPRWHHLVNLLFHIANTLLLFLVLQRMMRLRSEASSPQAATDWRSAFVAALFAVHPLHVESVAWIAERKDVLSGLFFMLTLWAYVRYVQSRSKVESRKSSAGSSSLPSTLNPQPSTMFWLCSASRWD